MPTSRNTKGVDLVIPNLNYTVTHSIQVKTLSKRNPIPMGNVPKKITFVVLANPNAQKFAKLIKKT